MFGLEGHKKKKKKTDEMFFELEAELSDRKKHDEIKKKVEDRIQSIKKLLRDGENKDDFDKYGKVLHGYTSLLKVMSRFRPK